MHMEDIHFEMGFSFPGAPDNLRHNQGTSFTPPCLLQLAAEADKTCLPVGAEAAYALIVGERYHKPLKDTFLKLQSTYKLKPLNITVDVTGPGRNRKMFRDISPDDEYPLAISIMSVNSTVGPEGI